MITIHFYKSDTEAGKLIRLFTGGRVNHVSVEVDGWFYEALMYKGFVKRQTTNRKAIVESFIFQQSRPDITEWLDRQVGKGYDWLGVLSFIWVFLKQKKGKWFCSENAMVVFCKIIGYTDYDQRKTPRQLLELIEIYDRRELNN